MSQPSKFLRHHADRKPSSARRLLATASIGGALIGASLWAMTPTAGSSPDPNAAEITVPIDIDSRIDETSDADFAAFVIATLNDPRSWKAAGFTFVTDPDAEYHVVLDEPSAVDKICGELKTNGKVSCQNGPYVALNADRWRDAVPHWDKDLAAYRTYLVNHEVGHLIGQRHPATRCPAAGFPAALMEQQTKSLDGCTGNSWPLWWEIDRAKARPVVFAPLPSWKPDPVPENLGGSIPPPTTLTTAPVTIPSGPSGATPGAVVASGESASAGGAATGASGVSGTDAADGSSGSSGATATNSSSSESSQGAGALDASNTGLGSLPVAADEPDGFWTTSKLAIAALLAAAAGGALLWLWHKRSRAERSAAAAAAASGAGTGTSAVGIGGAPAGPATSALAGAGAAAAAMARPSYRWDCHVFEDDGGAFLQVGSSFFYPASEGFAAADALTRLDEFVETERPTGAALHERVNEECPHLIEGFPTVQVPYMFAASKGQRLYLVTSGGASVRIERADGQVLNRVNFTARISASAENPARSVLVEFRDPESPEPPLNSSDPVEAGPEDEFAIEFVSERIDV